MSCGAAVGTEALAQSDACAAPGAASGDLQGSDNRAPVTTEPPPRPAAAQPRTPLTRSRNCAVRDGGSVAGGNSELEHDCCSHGSADVFRGRPNSCERTPGVSDKAQGALAFGADVRAQTDELAEPKTGTRS